MLQTFFLQRIWDIELHCDSYEGGPLCTASPRDFTPFNSTQRCICHLGDPQTHRCCALSINSSNHLRTSGEEHCAVRELGICSSWQVTREICSRAAKQRAAQHQRPHVSRENASTHSCTPGLEINTNQSIPDDKSAAERS